MSSSFQSKNQLADSIQLADPIWVDNQESFDQMIEHLRRNPIFALDTESDSLFSYYPKVCLIQISTCDTVNENGTATTSKQEIVDYLLDPLTFDHLDPLGNLLADPEIEVIIHSASNDILTLQRDFQFRFENIFDTQLSARILGWKQTGLAALLETYFGVKSNKKMQRTNWAQRPLTQQQISYARMDTCYLLALRELQIAALKEDDRLEEANEGFSFLSAVDYSERPVAERTFWSMKAARDVDHKHMGLLEALWQWREKESQRRDRPPFKVMNDRALIEIAQQKPMTRHQLQNIRGLGEHQLNRYCKQLLRTIKAGSDRPAPKQQHQRVYHDRLPEIVMDRYEALREWRTRRAKQRGVDPDIVFNNDTLMAIAKAAPDSESDLQKLGEIGPWKARAYGEKIFEIVARYS